MDAQKRLLVCRDIESNSKELERKLFRASMAESVRVAIEDVASRLYAKKGTAVKDKVKTYIDKLFNNGPENDEEETRIANDALKGRFNNG